MNFFAVCGEIGPLGDSSYQASSSVQLPRFAKLNTTDPGVNRRGWCPSPDDSDPYLQIDLGKKKIKKGNYESVLKFLI